MNRVNGSMPNPTQRIVENERERARRRAVNDEIRMIRMSRPTNERGHPIGCVCQPCFEAALKYENGLTTEQLLERRA